MKKIKKRIKQLWIILVYLLSIVLSKFIKKYNDVWLISERGDEARDNGYEFYKYLKTYHKEINVKYIITKNSYDLSKISKKDIIYCRSFNHYIAFLNSKFLISTHHMGCSPEFGMFGKLDDKGLVFTKGKRIFLQHGIIYNYLPSLVNKKIDLFITSSVKEQDFIINKFNYNKNIVKCTGIARFDDLKSGTGQYILVMPTWRSNLYYMNISDFKKSNYYIKWMEFLNSAKLHEILEEKNLKLMFYPHYETQKFFSKLTTESNRIIFASSHNYSIHELLKNCSMFITDYSSTFFDVGYMHKPILYYQFDYDEFYKTHYEHGYFDIKNDGFGESIRESNELISNLKKIVENEYKTNDIYLKRETDFYKYNDDKNCERIYEEIIKKEGE